jgi:hypothetical protein
MACPYFLPIEKLEGTWPHPHRLPLGCGWQGQCTAPGHDGEAPCEDELHEFCNLGYAKDCVRLPHNRAWDSIRFGARVLGARGNYAGNPNSSDNNAASLRIQIRYICERAHRPADHGVLIFDAQSKCERNHPDARLQRMAECFLQSYLDKMKRGETEQAIA